MSAQVMQTVKCVGGPLNGEAVEVAVGDSYFTCEWTPDKVAADCAELRPVFAGTTRLRYVHLGFGVAVCEEVFHAGLGGRA